MAASKGNIHWRLRTTHGRSRIFKTPKSLVEACNEYFEWCLKNPLKEQQVFHHQGQITKTSVNKMRPFSLEGLCNYLDISLNTFKNYEEREDFLIVTTRVRQIIDNQQFEGAAAGFLNPNIIARKLGLVDKKDMTTDGESLNKGFGDLMKLASKIETEDGAH
ncbi:MAG TPA: DNA-packaging protein [Emticicia sp.]